MPDTGNRAPGAPRLAATDPKLVELNMRRALGLTGATGSGRGAGAVPQQRPEQARGRHRFAQDGSVPVTVLNHRPDELAAKDVRIAELQAALDTERNAHAATRRTLAEQVAALQALQTRMAHTELAHNDALETERKALAVAQAALAEARAQPTFRRAPRPELSADAASPDDPAPAKAKRGRPRLHPPREPKPVRWWTPSYRAKTKA